jgi:hypothetical protein
MYPVPGISLHYNNGNHVNIYRYIKYTYLYIYIFLTDIDSQRNYP